MRKKEGERGRDWFRGFQGRVKVFKVCFLMSGKMAFCTEMEVRGCGSAGRRSGGSAGEKMFSRVGGRKSSSLEVSAPKLKVKSAKHSHRRVHFDFIKIRDNRGQRRLLSSPVREGGVEEKFMSL